MLITHTNSVYSDGIITKMENTPYPQYGHMVSDGGVAVQQGIKIMPTVLVDYVLQGTQGAAVGTLTAIQELLQHNNHKVGLILASGSNFWTGYLSSLKRSEEYPVNKIPILGSTQVYAGHIANKIGSFDYIASDSTSCISGHSAWYAAKNLINLGKLDAVVVISTDNGLSEDYLSIFGEAGLAKVIEEEDNSDIIKFRLGQGCNITILESYGSVLQTKNIPLAVVSDIHITTEHHSSPLGISSTGEGYSNAINGVNTRGVEFVKTHATFSEDNEIEETLIKQKFGNIRIVNYKLRIGHTMGASTAIETAIAIQEEQGKFLSLGAGMGNVFSAAVVQIL